jgi:hypothetical protein
VFDRESAVEFRIIAAVERGREIPNPRLSGLRRCRHDRRDLVASRFQECQADHGYMVPEPALQDAVRLESLTYGCEQPAGYMQGSLALQAAWGLAERGGEILLIRLLHRPGKLAGAWRNGILLPAVPADAQDGLQASEGCTTTPPRPLPPIRLEFHLYRSGSAWVVDCQASAQNDETIQFERPRCPRNSPEKLGRRAYGRGKNRSEMTIAAITIVRPTTTSPRSPSYRSVDR